MNGEKCIVISLIFMVLLGGVQCHWGYRSPDQRRWRRINGNCAGQNQSPISISARRAIPIMMPAIEMIGYHDPLPGPLKLTNNGHSVSLSIPRLTPEEERYGTRIPYVFGGRLDSEYELEGLHFHWGDKNNRGSEHVLNDIRYPMEMHIIHRNVKYKDLEEALQHKDGLTVLAFFYQITEATDGKELAPLMKVLPLLEQKDTSMIMNQTFTLASMIPVDMSRYYMYKGSLTTPPCSEVVSWIIFSEPLPISVFQMDKFRRLSASTETFLVDNFRVLQPLNGRRVFVRVVSNRYPRIQKFGKIHYSQWDWLGPPPKRHQNDENDVSLESNEDNNISQRN